MSSYKKRDLEKIFSEHIHYWTPTIDPEAQICVCGKWLISDDTRRNRIAEWSNYYQLLTTTPSYLDWVEMSQAFREKNLPKIAEIKKRIELRCKRISFDNEEDNWEYTYDYLAIPDKPNPENFPYIILS